MLTKQLVQWAQDQDLVRAVLLSSSRASRVAKTDALSDFDIVLIVTDATPLLQDLMWQETMGEIMVRLPVAAKDVDGLVTHSRLVIHTDGTKIDYTIMPQNVLEVHRKLDTLPDNLDVGYRVLLDKARLCYGLAKPTYAAHIPAKPTQAEFTAVVEEFFWETHYVAKNLWRDELWQAKYSLEMVMKLNLLRKMLEWFVELRENWTFRPGPFGKGLKAQLPSELWTAFEATFADADTERNWLALFATIELFRWVATDVADQLGFVYSYRLDQQVCRYLGEIKALPAHV